MQPLAANHPLTKLFAGLTEQTFLGEVGIPDTNLIDYVTDLLVRFIHRDNVYAVRGPEGGALEELAAMAMEADRPEHHASARREIFRHMGDFALFWTGVYPEALHTRAARARQDALLNYCEQGKRSYYLASTYVDNPNHAAQAPVLRRLSNEFDRCVYGLRLVRSHWEEKQ